MAHWHKTKIPDSRFADAIKCFFLFTLHNKRYVNLAIYLSACAAYTKYQQRSAFYYTRWFFRHSAVGLIQWTLNIINSKTQNTMGQYSHVTNTRIMTFWGRSVQCLILYLSRIQFSSDSPLFLVSRKYQAVSLFWTDAIFPPTSFVFITKPRHRNSKWNSHVHLNNDNKNSLLKRLNKTSKLALEGSQRGWGEVPTQIPAERALEIHNNDKSRIFLQSANRVGEFRESDDWSPLLLLRRWALEQDSDEGDGLSGSSMLGYVKMRLGLFGVDTGVEAATTGVLRLSPSEQYMPPPRQMGLMTECWAFASSSSSSSSSKGSCLTTTGLRVLIGPRGPRLDRMVRDRGAHCWECKLWWRSSSGSLHTGLWATNINSNLSFSFCRVSISFCRSAFSSSNFSVSLNEKKEIQRMIMLHFAWYTFGLWLSSGCCYVVVVSYWL